jgi:glycerol uptake facilitator protein
MLPYIAEFLGTMLLIILGDGVVANVTLNKSGMKGAGSIQITLAWGLAVMLPAFIFGAASGAHFNPALTLALAIEGSLAWGLVPGYIAAQFAGAILGAVIVYLMFKDQFDATEDPGTKLGVFSTGPSIPNLPRNIFCEAVATFVLVFAIKGVPAAAPAGVSNLASILRTGLCSRSIDPFRRHIVTQDGTVINDGSRSLTPDEVLRMDWLCDNVEGHIPGFEELEAYAKPIVRQLGIYRDKIPAEKEDTP